MIDGIDITKIGPKRLNSAMSIISYEPVLFNEPISYCFDPIGSKISHSQEAGQTE